MDRSEEFLGWAEGLWEPGRAQVMDLHSADKSGTLEERITRLEDERDIERTLRRYQNCYDAGDIDGVMSCFTEDAIQVNGRGTFVGADSIRASSQYLIDDRKLIVHYAVGVVVHVDPRDPVVGYLTCRHMAFMSPVENSPNVHGGTYVLKLRRESGKWLISHMRITFNFQYDVQPVSRRTAGSPPPPDLPMKQTHLVEAHFLAAGYQPVV